MPCYEFVHPATGKVTEWFGAHADRPRILPDGSKYCPSVPADVHSTAGLWNGSRPDFKKLTQNGAKIIREPGLARDIKREKAAKEARLDKEYEKAAVKAVREVMV
jgi:hypothetical protein